MATKNRKATSDRVSRIAGRLLRLTRGYPASDTIGGHGIRLTFGDVRALAGSALSQDETPRRVKRKR